MPKKVGPADLEDEYDDIDIDMLEEGSYEDDDETELDEDGQPVFKHNHEDTVFVEDTKNNYYDVLDSSIEKGTLVWVRSKPLIFFAWVPTPLSLILPRGLPFRYAPAPIFPHIWDGSPIDKFYYKIKNYNRNVNAAFDTILFSELHLSWPVVNSLFRVFQRADDDNGFGVDILELLMFLDVERTPFSMSLFKLMDADGGGDLNFVEFAVCYWNYCSLTLDSLYHFVFDMVSNKSNPEEYVLGEPEIKRLIMNLFGEDWEERESRHAAAAESKLLRLWKILDKKGEPFHFNMFMSFMLKEHLDKHLFPALQFQTKMRKVAFGNRWWEKAAKKRTMGVDDPVGFMLKLMKRYAELLPGNEKDKYLEESESEEEEDPNAIVWQQFKGKDGLYWYDAKNEKAVWTIPEAHHNKLMKMVLENVAPKKTRWEEFPHTDKDIGGSFFSDGRNTLWEKPLELQLVDFQADIAAGKIQMPNMHEQKEIIAGRKLPPGRPAALIVIIYEALDLRSADGPLGKSDPFCKVTIAGAEDEGDLDEKTAKKNAKAQAKRKKRKKKKDKDEWQPEFFLQTKTVNNDLNPKWNEAFLFAFPESVKQELFCKIYDSDKGLIMNGSDDFLGGCFVDLSSVHSETVGWKRFEVPLTGCKKNRGALVVMAHKYETPQVTFHSAKGLRNADGYFGKSDPYATVTGLMDPDEVWCKTAVIQNTLNPEWNETHPVKLVEEMPLGGRLCPCVLKVWDEDVGMLDNTDDPLGHVELDWTEVWPDNLITEQIFPLAGKSAKRNSTITVSVTGEQWHADPRPEYCVIVHSANGLRSADGPLGKSDPYCTLSYAAVDEWGRGLDIDEDLDVTDTETDKKQRKKNALARKKKKKKIRPPKKKKKSDPDKWGPVLHTKTKVVNNNCNPIWNEAWVFCMPITLPPKLHLIVYDSDAGTMFNGSDDFLGECIVDLTDIHPAVDDWQTMEIPLSGNKAKGTVTILARAYGKPIVTLDRANNLRNAHGMLGKSDPYGKAVGLFEADEEWGKTRTIKDTIDPVFDHDFKIPLLDVMPLGGKLKPLYLQMYDVDDGLFDNTDDALGQVMLDWQQLFPNANGNKRARGEYTLDVGKIKSEKARGTAVVRTTLEPRFDAKFFKKTKKNPLGEDDDEEMKEGPKLDEKGRPPPPKARHKRGKPPPGRPTKKQGPPPALAGAVVPANQPAAT
jgi:hypothetical protein